MSTVPTWFPRGRSLLLATSLVLWVVLMLGFVLDWSKPVLLVLLCLLGIGFLIGVVTRPAAHSRNYRAGR